MNLKNYTSSAPVINSIVRIENRLAQAGATHIAKTYDKDKTGRPIGMLDQVEAIEIFLPYAYDGKTDQTLFEKMKENNYKLLNA